MVLTGLPNGGHIWRVSFPYLSFLLGWVIFILSKNVVDSSPAFSLNGIAGLWGLGATAPCLSLTFLMNSIVYLKSIFFGGLALSVVAFWLGKCYAFLRSEFTLGLSAEMFLEWAKTDLEGWIFLTSLRWEWSCLGAEASSLFLKLKSSGTGVKLLFLLDFWEGWPMSFLNCVNKLRLDRWDFSR